MVNYNCETCINQNCDECNNPKAYATKEEIYCAADNASYIHGNTFETTFSDEQEGYDSTVGTKYRWKGTVKITIEPVPCCCCGQTGKQLVELKDVVGGDEWAWWCRDCLAKEGVKI